MEIVFSQVLLMKFPNIHFYIIFRQNQFVGIGSPLIDIVVNVNDCFFEKYDLKRNESSPFTSQQKGIFESIERLKPTYHVGGSVTNTIRILQFIIEHEKFTCFIGAIGTDTYGQILKDKLNSAHVNFIYEDVPTKSTGKCAVLINKENRSLCTELGASKYLSTHHLLLPHTQEIIKHAKYLYMSVSSY